VSNLRVAVLGVGLIGGSIGLAARRRLGAHVVGYDADGDALLRAKDVGAIDESAGDIGTLMRDADYAFVATPVASVVPVANAALSFALSGAPECVVSDVGSTKRHIANGLPYPNFVPGHPLAGAETGGVENAREDLFDDALWYLTPAGADTAPALARMEGLIEQIGATPMVLSPDAHDRLMASVSHLPHVLANVLVAQALRAAPALTGGGAGTIALGTNPSFRDATRVAGANTKVWTDIYLSNSDLLAEALDEAIQELSGVRDALDAEDAEALAAWNERARAGRERLAGDGLKPTSDGDAGDEAPGPAKPPSGSGAAGEASPPAQGS
jgi:prephenate dehydrogenase